MFICYDNASDYMLHSYNKTVVSSNFTTTTSKSEKNILSNWMSGIVAYSSFLLNYQLLVLLKSLWLNGEQEQRGTHLEKPERLSQVI